MKKLAMMLLGLSRAVGCVSVGFAQDQKDTTKKESKKKGKKGKKSEAPK